jgi:hypothetical protein
MIKISIIVISGFFIFKIMSNFLYIDLAQGCFIKLLPSWDFNFNQSVIKKGLVVIKNALPDDYKNVCKRINTIDPNFDCGKAEGGCYWHGNPKRISVSTKQSQLNWVPAVIVHETCHSQQDSENRETLEPECYRESDRILRALSVYSQ